MGVRLGVGLWKAWRPVSHLATETLKSQRRSTSDLTEGSIQEDSRFQAGGNMALVRTLHGSKNMRTLVALQPAAAIGSAAIGARAVASCGNSPSQYESSTDNLISLNSKSERWRNLHDGASQASSSRRMTFHRCGKGSDVVSLPCELSGEQ